MEHEPRVAQSVKEAVDMYMPHDKDTAIDWLRKHPEEVHEFCLLVQESYAKEDRTTPILELSEIIKRLL